VTAEPALGDPLTQFVCRNWTVLFLVAADDFVSGHTRVKSPEVLKASAPAAQASRTGRAMLRALRREQDEAGKIAQNSEHDGNAEECPQQRGLDGERRPLPAQPRDRKLHCAPPNLWQAQEQKQIEAGRFDEVSVQ